MKNLIYIILIVIVIVFIIYIFYFLPRVKAVEEKKSVEDILDDVNDVDDDDLTKPPPKPKSKKQIYSNMAQTLLSKFSGYIGNSDIAFIEAFAKKATYDMSSEDLRGIIKEFGTQSTLLIPIGGSLVEHMKGVKHSTYPWVSINSITRSAFLERIEKL